MQIRVERAEYKEVQLLRDLYRHEAHCQIVHDSFLARGLSDPYLLLVDGSLVGYGAVNNKYDKGRVSEFYTLPAYRASSLPLCRELLAVSQATQLEAQTNMPAMLMLLYDCAVNVFTESILFHDAVTTHLACPNAIFRRTMPEDAAAMFPHHSEPVGEWIVETQGKAVASGGFLCHYNPPYGDVFMEVDAPFRQQGIGSFLVQEVKRACYEAGKKPSARCHPDNTASRRTLQKAGFLPCARLLAGDVNITD